MKNFLFTKCEINDVIKRRFGVTPVRIEPHFNHVHFNLNASSSQNKVYTWRYDRPIQEGGVVSSSLAFPFFVGKVDYSIYNDASTFTNVSGFFVQVSAPIINSIGAFYSISQEKWAFYADGTDFEGPLLPVKSAHEGADQLNNPHDVIGPYMTVQVFLNATGALSAQLTASFEGYMIYLS